jgi:hypothetical protein
MTPNPTRSTLHARRSTLFPFPTYGWIGLGLILCEEVAMTCNHFHAAPGFFWYELAGWATPVCWWGYILLVDAYLYRRRGESLIMNRREIFWLQCILSFSFWVWFEGYNVLMPGWQYVNLIEYKPYRFAGYIFAFATIMPGMFETTELIQFWGCCRTWKRNSETFKRQACEIADNTGPNSPAAARHSPLIPSFWLNLSIFIGALFCFVPPLLGGRYGGYLWAFVWCGWVFLLDPINYRRGGQSIFGDWAGGDFSRFGQLMIAGAICGFLWEFWNFWATTKWIYIFPWLNRLRLFEMPIAGFLGFPSFNVEYFVMFHFIALFFTKEDKLKI